MLRKKIIALSVLMFAVTVVAGQNRKTSVEIKGEQFFINGKPTYEGRTWQGLRIEGLLMNSRMVQGIFDDLNPETVGKWAYPDTKKWDPGRNTREFTRCMKTWRSYGLLSFTINMQGGSPQGYSQAQPWHNSAYFEDGSLRPDYMKRLKKILDKADKLGMVPIVGFFYFGQDERLDDEKAVRNAVLNMTNWLLDKKYRNILVEVNNECNIKYDHEILNPSRVHELIDMIKNVEKDGYRLYAGTSYGGGFIPLPNVVKSSDFLLMHGNGVSDPLKILEMVSKARKVEGYSPKPILFNEDDHYDFNRDENNLIAALRGYASWGFFDFRRGNESYNEGYQSVPVSWKIDSDRKKQFFNLVKVITGTE